MRKHLFLMGCAMSLAIAPARSEQHTELGKHMEAINDAFKALRRETDSAKGAAQAREAQTETLKAAAEIPALLKKMPEGPDKVKAAAEYRKAMGKLYTTFCEVELAFLANKPEEVTQLVETLKTEKKEGHDKFMEKDKE